MPHSVEIRRGGATVYTFAAPTPLAKPRHRYEHDDQDPKRVTAIAKTFTLEGVFYGDEESIDTQWDALVAELEKTDTNQLDGFRFLRDAAELEAVDKTSGYDEVIVESFEAVHAAGMWTRELRFVIVVTGKRRLADSDGIVKLTQEEDYSYDDRGLLTRTLIGEVETKSDTSAETKARTLGLTLPSANFGFMTKGPEGVNILIRNRGDTFCRFISIIAENGQALPGNVSPTFSAEVAETIQEGERFTVTVAAARGTGALAAVQALKPGDTFSETVGSDAKQRTARAIYIQRNAEGDSGGSLRLLRLRRFRHTGGGRPIRHTRRTNNREPAQHVMTRTPAEVVEEITVEVFGTPGVDDFTLPKALTLPEDTDAFEQTWPTRVSIGRERSGDKWVASFRRVYRPTKVDVLPASLGVAIFRDQDDESSSPRKEARRQAAGRLNSSRRITEIERNR